MEIKVNVFLNFSPKISFLPTRAASLLLYISPFYFLLIIIGGDQKGKNINHLFVCSLDVNKKPFTTGKLSRTVF